MTGNAGPLAGVHVLDLTWVMVGPTTTRYLADLGAEVIKVESSHRIDPVRTLGPFMEDEEPVERSVSYHNFNAGKRCVTLDLKRPEARRVLEPLIRWADVVIESFAPGAAGRLGLDDAGVRAVREDVITVSTSIGGVEWGAGVGTMGASICGATHLMGRPEEPPVGPFGPWTDEVAPRFIAVSVLAALRRRALTGQGCSIDVAQAEAGIQFLLPALYQQAIDGRTAGPRPLDQPDPWRCPANAYLCRDDRWVVIDASDPEPFRSLRTLVGGELDDPAFDTLVGRLRERRRLDRALVEWSRTRDADEVEQVLQRHGIPAHVASSTRDFASDRDLRASVLAEVALSNGRRCDLLRRSFRLDGRAEDPTPGPRLGQHTDEVLVGVCGLSRAEVQALRNTGVLH